MKIELEDFAERATAFDFETDKIQPGLLAPPVVCGSYASKEQIEGVALQHDEALRVFGHIIDDRIYVGANAPFDMLCAAVEAREHGVDIMPEIFRAYDEGRVFDVQVAEALHAIAEGHLGLDPRTGGKLRDPETNEVAGYRLSVVMDLVLDRADAKRFDRWRTSYALLRDVPWDEWPEDAKAYMRDDVRNPLDAARAQVGIDPVIAPHDWQATRAGATDTASAGFRCARCDLSLEERGESRGCELVQPRRNLHNHAAQVYAQWALHLGAAWGIRTDPVAVQLLHDAAMVGRTASAPRFVELGWLREDGSEVQAAVRTAVARAYGANTPCREEGCTDGRTPGVTPKGKATTRTCVVCNGTGLHVPDVVPRSEPSGKFPCGQIKIGRDVLTESGDEDLMAYGESQEDDKILDTYLPELLKGCSIPITLRPNSPLETGRVSYSGIWQLLPRGISARLQMEVLRLAAERGIRPLTGVRDCVIPRPGWTFYSVDYTGGELVTFAEACKRRVGFSRMGEALIRGIDVHAALGATMAGVPYDEFMRWKKGTPYERAKYKAYRNTAKGENFGNPGGMGAARKTLQYRAGSVHTPHPNGPTEVDDGTGKLVRGYRGLRPCILVGGKDRCGTVKVTEWKDRTIPPTCRDCIEQGELGREAWFRQWPEAKPFLNWHSQNVEDRGEVVQIYSGRVRGGVDFCAEANGDFQGLLADIATRALCRVAKEQYVRTIVVDEPGMPPSLFAGQVSPLFGNARGSIFAHDELFGEARREVGHECALRIKEIMVEEFRRGCPEHAEACRAEETLMPRWYKQAGPVYHGGRLVEWTPEHDPNTCTECDRS